MSEHGTRTQNSCAEAGLDCETCVASTARELAQTCRGLRGKMVAQLFVQLYPEPGCARMHAKFSASYRAASSPAAGGDDWEEIPAAAAQADRMRTEAKYQETRRKAEPARPARVMFAVA